MASSSSSAEDLKRSFLELAQAGSASDFIDIVDSLGGRRAASSGLSLAELMSVLSKVELEQLWSSMIQRRWFATAMSFVEGTPAEQLFDELESLPGDTHVTSSREESVACLGAVGTCILKYLQTCQPSSVSDDCHALACNLHDIIFELGTGDKVDTAVQKTIGRICEAWCLERVEGFENMVARFVPLLLFTALGEDARRADVQRLYALRSVLSVFEIDDPSSESLRSQLLNCFISPRFLSLDDNNGKQANNVGTKFLVHVFLLSRSMMADVHAAVKNQIPYTTAKAVLAGYGELYFAVWDTAARSGNDALRDHFETTCLQDLFSRAVHARPEVFKNLMRVLSPIHEHKRDTGAKGQKQAGAVDSMLLRLYAPFLWRSMKVANSTVRRNALVLLADVFPLQEPSSTNHAEIEELAARQHSAFMSGLMDPSPAVRVVAIEGACRALGTFWEIVPETFKKETITCFVKQLVFDQSSAAVRAAVFEGILFVLDNRLSHGVMKRVLPSLASSIHDKAERVRSRFLDVLLQVKRIRDIQFFDVVAVDDLLERLALDVNKPAMAKRLTSLLLNSYFPNSGVRERLSRAKVLMEMNPAAAVAFYSNLRQHAALPDVCSLLDAFNKCMVTILKQMARSVQETSGGGGGGGGGGRARKRSLSAEDEDAAAGPGLDQPITDVALKGHATKVLLLLHVVTGTWESISKDLSKRGGAKAAAYLRETLAGDFCDTARAGLAGFFPAGVVEALLCRLAALVDVDDCEDFRAGILPKLVALATTTDTTTSPGGADETAYGPLVELSCRWRLEGDIVDLALTSLDQAFEDNNRNGDGDDATAASIKRTARGSRARKAKKKNKKKKGALAATATVPPEFATQLLLLIFAKNFNGARDRLLESAVVVERLRASFARVLPEVAHRLESAATAGSSAGPTGAALTNEALVNLALCAFKFEIHFEIFEQTMYGGSASDSSSAAAGSKGVTTFSSMLDEVARSVIPAYGLFGTPATSHTATTANATASPARQRRRRKDTGEHTPSRLARATNLRPASGAAQQLLWSVAAVAVAMAHDYVALQLNMENETTVVFRFLAEATQALSNAVASTPAATHAFTAEAGTIYRHAAGALAIVTNPEVCEIASLEQWRGEQASLAERAFRGVLRINESALVADSAQLVPDFVARFVFRQSVLAQAFVPVLVNTAVRGTASDDGMPNEERSAEQAHNIAEQTRAITALLLDHTSQDPVVFCEASRALCSAVDAMGPSMAASRVNAACQLLSKVVAQGCSSDARGGDEANSPHQRPFSHDELAEVRNAVNSVHSWLRRQASDGEAADAENTAPAAGQATTTSSPGGKHTGSATATGLAARFGLSTQIAAGLVGAVNAHMP